jgi:hypothetical protein
MPALDQKATCAPQTVVSALPPKATLNAFSSHLLKMMQTTAAAVAKDNPKKPSKY